MACPPWVSTSARKVGLFTQNALLLKQSCSVLKLMRGVFHRCPRCAWRGLSFDADVRDLQSRGSSPCVSQSDGDIRWSHPHQWPALGRKSWGRLGCCRWCRARKAPRRDTAGAVRPLQSASRAVSTLLRLETSMRMVDARRCQTSIPSRWPQRLRCG